jgi:hypothetical protein
VALPGLRPVGLPEYPGLKHMDFYLNPDSAVDSRKKAQKAQRNTDAKILELTRQVNGFLIGFLICLFVFAPFVPSCGNSN